MELKELRNTGMLWLINRVVFHPRGFALALYEEEDGTVSGWDLLGSGVQVWAFKDTADDDCFKRAEEFLAATANDVAATI